MIDFRNNFFLKITGLFVCISVFLWILLVNFNSGNIIIGYSLVLMLYVSFIFSISNIAISISRIKKVDNVDKILATISLLFFVWFLFEKFLLN
jgi:hypothetical protein